jgi:hypothetical protein
VFIVSLSCPFFHELTYILNLSICAIEGFICFLDWRSFAKVFRGGVSRYKDCCGDCGSFHTFSKGYVFTRLCLFPSALLVYRFPGIKTLSQPLFRFIYVVGSFDNEFAGI